MRPPAYLLLVLAAALLPAYAGTPEVTVSDAWIRAVPGSDVAAAYLTVRNSGTHPVTIVAISSPAAASAMIHETTLVGTQSTMRPREQLPLAPGQTLHFGPGGLHVMLMNLRQALNPGDQVQLVLLFAGGTSLTTTAPVRPLAAQ